MLLEFSVNNYRSIKDTINISMVSKNKTHYFVVQKYNILQSAVIYGANASGKSNVVRAFDFMKQYVLNTKKVMQSVDKLPHDPFLLNTGTELSSSFFEIVFFINNIKYRYGFEADESIVYAEWLFEDRTGKKEAKLFHRDYDDKSFYVNNSRFKEGVGLKARDNQLFLWKCDQEGGEISKSILQWFITLNFIDGIEHKGYIAYTMDKLSDPELKQNVLNLMTIADIGIKSFDVLEEELSKKEIEQIGLPDKLKKALLADSKARLVEANIKTMHTKYDDNNAPLDTDAIFDLNKQESEGTRKFFALSAPILDTLENGGVLLVDELDASLHPLLTKKLISLFHDKDINKKNAQLIFVTHDTNLLNPVFFARDQIWFTEKDSFGSTHCTSLLEFKGVRATDNFEKNYIMGKYGAIPYIGDFSYKEGSNNG